MLFLPFVWNTETQKKWNSLKYSSLQQLASRTKSPVIILLYVCVLQVWPNLWVCMPYTCQLLYCCLLIPVLIVAGLSLYCFQVCTAKSLGTLFTLYRERVHVSAVCVGHSKHHGILKKLFPVHKWEMCEVCVQIADLIIYHEAPPIGSCFRCWSCSNRSVHVLTWSRLFIQAVTSHSCT